MQSLAAGRLVSAAPWLRSSSHPRGPEQDLHLQLTDCWRLAVKSVQATVCCPHVLGGKQNQAPWASPIAGQEQPQGGNPFLPACPTLSHCLSPWLLHCHRHPLLRPTAAMRACTGGFPCRNINMCLVSMAASVVCLFC